MKTALLLVFFLLFMVLVSKGQLCSGSLGEPIINVTFGSGGGQLPAGATDFTYTRGCPGKEQYTLANLIFGCGEDRSWVMIAGDHTRDQGGNYMIVNAQGGDNAGKTATVHRDTVTQLCNNVTYVYSAWITSALRPASCGGRAARANLIFKVATLSGAVIDTFDTGPLPVEEDRRWVQYGVSFRVPPGESSVVLTISTARNPVCGQGFAIDDITLRPCGPQVAATSNGTTDHLNVCADATKNFVFKASYAAGFANPVAQWQRSLDTGKTWLTIAGANSLDYSVPQSTVGLVHYRLAVAEGSNIEAKNCRFLSNVLTTEVHPVPPHKAPQTVLGCLDKNLQLPQRDPFAISNIWRGPNGYTSALEKAVVPNLSYADTGLYQLQTNYHSGCATLDSFYVNAFPSTTINVAPTFAICEGQSVVLNATGEGNFFWQPATGLSDASAAAPVASPRDTTLYKVTVTNEYGCKDSALVQVYVYRNPVAFAGPDRTIVRGDSVMLSGRVSGTGVIFQWSPSAYMNNSNLASPVVAPPADMPYTLLARSTVGCGTATSTAMVKVYNDIFIPNSFTPNKDGRNDHFRVKAADGYQVLRFQIFNRWGQVVYSTTDFSRGWDGTFQSAPQPEGSYVYFLQLKSSRGKLIEKKGTVTLMR